MMTERVTSPDPLVQAIRELREADVLFSLAEGQNVKDIGRVAKEWTIKNLVPRDLVGWCGDELRLTRKGLERTLEILNELEEKGHLGAGNRKLREKLRKIEASLPRDIIRQW